MKEHIFRFCVEIDRIPLQYRHVIPQTHQLVSFMVHALKGKSGVTNNVAL